MQACHHHRTCIRVAAKRAARAVGTGNTAIATFSLDPVHAKVAQLLRRERVGRARVAPAHVPEIFGKHHAVLLACGLRLEHGFVERREVLFAVGLDVGRNVDVGRQLHGAVVGGLDPALRRQHPHHEVLRPLGIDHPQADRQHEFFALERERERTQKVGTALGLLCQIDLGNEKFHALADVGRERFGGALGNAVAALREPGFQAVGFFCAEDHNVVGADGVFSFDGDAEFAGGVVAGHGFADCSRRRCHLHSHFGAARRAGIGIEILRQPRRGVGIKPVEQGLVGGAHLLLLQYLWHRHHQRKFLQITLIVVEHVDGGAVAVAHHHHL